MPIGDGYFGSPKGTFGKYVTSPATSPLSAQFATSTNIEEQQRRRYKRKHESGYVGNGYTWGYPYVVATLGANAYQDPNLPDHDQPMSGAADVAAATDGSGMGGTAAGYVGGLGS